MKFRLLGICTLLLFLAGAWLWPSQAQRGGQKSAPTGSAPRGKAAAAKPGRGPQKATPLVPVYSQAVDFAESKPVRSLARVGQPIFNSKPGGPEVEPREMNEKNSEDGREWKGDKASPDGALQARSNVKAPSALPSPSLTFDGIAFTDGNSGAPPDTVGDVGPNHYIQMTNNTTVGIFNKSGTLLVPYFKLNTLFAPLTGIVTVLNPGDPIVLYDRMADRWMISQFVFTGTGTMPPYHEAIAISKNGDPTGGWYLYDFVLPGNEFPDYPHFGVWPDGYYMNTHQFLNGGPNDGDGVFAFDRKKMLVGDPTAGLIYFNLNLATHPEFIFGMLPADQDGILPPPAGAPEVFAYFTDTDLGDPADGLRLFDFHADFTTPALSTFTERTESTYATPLALAAFDSRNPSGRGDVEQPPPAGNNSTDRLDSVSTRLMNRLQYINRNGTESLVGNFTVNVSGVSPTSAANYQAAFRYFELRRTMPNGLFSVNEQATFSPDAGNGATGDNRWMASAAMDNQGNLMVGYTKSGVQAGHFPSLSYAARAFNDAPGGLFQGEGVMFAGTGVQRGTSNRWGDYSALSLDPSDDCSFWYTNEYYTSTTLTFNWRTRIGKVRFASCLAPAQGTLSGTVTFCDTGLPAQYATVTATGGPSSGFSTTTLANGTYSLQLAPGTYSVTIASAPHDCMTIGPFMVTINDGQTTTQNGCLSGAAKFLYQSSAISGGDGDGIIERNECNNLNVTILNDGCFTGSNVTATLSSSTPGVTITQPNSPYPSAAEGATTTNSVPFAVSTSNSFSCGTAIDFTLTVTFTGGTSTVNFSLPTCQCPTQTVSGSLAAGDTTQTGRMGRDAITPNCVISKACPGAIAGDTAQHAYDLYTFTNGPAAACVTITTTTSCGTATANQIITVAYLGSFNPANLCTNYLGDPGASPAPTNSFKVNVPANGVLLVNVQEITAGGGCSGYSVSVDGLICDTAGNGPCAACMITCPANITQSNDPNQCGAVVNYPAPTTTGTCGTVACSPASGSFFPKGTTTVTCTTTAGPGCSFTVTVNDTQPPTIGPCPANITAKANTINDPCKVVTYTNPPASDNCPGVTVACSPASGSCFAVGTTTVTCTATDTSGNTATCSFSVSVFNVCIQDDSNPSIVFLGNSKTGDYRFCCGGTTFTGKAKVTIAGNVVTFEHNATDRKVLVRDDEGAFRATGSLQMPPGTTRCTITDRDTRNNTCICQ
ncbi:MAG TPA: HYR domain-containing protein [Blastocatellia bacterium]|nr:HYR domain-containing protein [Blastocatellia bacterium]